MSPYNIYPAVDENYKFPPKIIDSIANSTEFSAIRWVKPLPASIANLDQLVASGLYGVDSESIANRPTTGTGTVAVTVSGDTTMQEWTSLNSSTTRYNRLRVGSGSWSGWKKFTAGDWSIPGDSTLKDLDLYTTEGRYSVTTAGVANRPVSASGTLMVDVLGDVVTQEWSTLDARPRRFLRARVGGVWSTWMNIAWATPPSIIAGSDMDTYTTPGTYIVTSSNVSNKPTTGLGFLEVVQIATTSFMQRWTPFDGAADIMVRSRTSSGWKAWNSGTWWKGHLTRGVDLDTLTRPSAYSLTWIDHPHQPTGRVGTLEITQGGAVVVQTFEPSTGSTTKFRRTFDSGVWGSWEEISSGGASTGTVSSLTLWQPTKTAKPQGDIVAAYTLNKAVGFNSNHDDGQLKFTRDDGDTWTNLFKFSEAFSSVRQLPDGQLLASVGSDPNPRSLWKSTGYSDANPAAATWAKVLTASAPYIYYASAWSFSVHENIVLVAEYGPKSPTWNDISITSPARYVRMSKDYGKTWTLAFDLVSYLKNDRGLSNTDGQHLHGVLWDPYWDRIWVSYGDDTNGLVYSDDEGSTWKTANWGPVPSSPWQAVGMAALPDCILFGSDGPPNGVWRLDRVGGKSATEFKIQAAYTTPNDLGILSHLCQGILKVPSVNGDIHLFGFGTEGQPGKTFVVGTRDGRSFTRIWEDPSELPLGRGVRTMAGPNLKGELIVGSNDEASAGNWSEWRGYFNGDPRISWSAIDDKPALYTQAEVDAKIESNRWERPDALVSGDNLDTLPSGAYRVANSSVAAALGFPTANSGELIVYKPYGATGVVGRMIWLPTNADQTWQTRKHGGAWLPWRLTDGPAQVIDATSWFDGALGNYVSDTKLVVSPGGAVQLTISGRADQTSGIPNKSVIGTIPAAYRPRASAWALGQSVSGEGMKADPSGSIVSPAISTGAYFKVTLNWVV